MRYRVLTVENPFSRFGSGTSDLRFISEASDRRSRLLGTTIEKGVPARLNPLCFDPRRFCGLVFSASDCLLTAVEPVGNCGKAERSSRLFQAAVEIINKKLRSYLCGFPWLRQFPQASPSARFFLFGPFSFFVKTLAGLADPLAWRGFRTAALFSVSQKHHRGGGAEALLRWREAESENPRSLRAIGVSC